MQPTNSSNIDDRIDLWHECGLEGEEIWDFLGVNPLEYRHWVTWPSYPIKASPYMKPGCARLLYQRNLLGFIIWALK